MIGRQAHPELIIFNSLEDGEKTKVAVPPQSLLRVSTKHCYLVIPVWIAGEEHRKRVRVIWKDKAAPGILRRALDGVAFPRFEAER
jgi:hypothetical protein